MPEKPAPQKRRFIDVWIVESNTVYREVPFAVVTDWIQQGRLLADDRVRPSGTAEWFPIGGSASFAAYVPKMETNRANDQAEALEPVQVEFTWKRPHEAEDEDVDMIPLIDISLVLLIFFMMTAAAGAGAFDFQTPEARNKNVQLAQDMQRWVGMDVRDSPQGRVVEDRSRPYYSLGWKDEVMVKPTRDKAAVLARLREMIDQAQGRVMVRLRANRLLPVETVTDMTVALKSIQYQENKKHPNKVDIVVVGEVSEPKVQ